MSSYLDLLIRQNEAITGISNTHASTHPKTLGAMDEPYFMKALAEGPSAPTPKFRQWMAQELPSLETQAIFPAPRPAGQGQGRAGP